MVKVSSKKSQKKICPFRVALVFDWIELSAKQSSTTCTLRLAVLQSFLLKLPQVMRIKELVLTEIMD